MGNNKNTTISSAEKIEQLGKIYYNGTDHLTFFVLRHQVSGQPVVIDDELFTYVEMHFQQITNNWLTKKGFNTRTIQKVPFKICTQEDFGEDEVSIEYFSAWDGFQLICPKFDHPGDGFYVEGEQASVVSKTFEFNINKCTDQTKCKSLYQIDKFIHDIQVDVWHLQLNMDFTNFDKTTGPVFKDMRLLYSNYLRPETILVLENHLSKNYYTLKDTYLQILKWFDTTGSFFQIEHSMQKDQVSTADPNALFVCSFWLQPNIKQHKRVIFGWFDLLGKLGGITNVMMLLFGFFLFSISEHSFVLKAAKKLFIARTRTDLFKYDPRQNIEIKALSKKVEEELQMHRAIKFHYKDNVCLYISNKMGCLFPSRCWPNKNKFQKIYKLTQQRLNDELNIVKTIKSLRNQEILNTHSHQTQEIKNQIMHNEKNLLNLEDTSDFESDEPSNDVSVKFDDSQVYQKYNNLQKDILKSLNKAHKYKPSQSEHREEKKEILNQKIKCINDLVKLRPNGHGYSEGMAALIITRWAKRQLYKDQAEYSSKPESQTNTYFTPNDSFRARKKKFTFVKMGEGNGDNPSLNITQSPQNNDRNKSPINKSVKSKKSLSKFSQSPRSQISKNTRSQQKQTPNSQTQQNRAISSKDLKNHSQVRRMQRDLSRFNKDQLNPKYDISQSQRGGRGVDPTFSPRSQDNSLSSNQTASFSEHHSPNESFSEPDSPVKVVVYSSKLEKDLLGKTNKHFKNSRNQY